MFNWINLYYIILYSNLVPNSWPNSWLDIVQVNIKSSQNYIKCVTAIVPDFKPRYNKQIIIMIKLI